MVARKRLDSRWWDAAGVVGAVLLGVVALVLLLGSQRADVLLFGADSAVMPLVERGIERGDPYHWRMTSTVFAVEIPIYALIGIFVKSTVTQVLVSGIVNFVFLYAALRWLAGIISPSRHRAGTVAISLMAAAIPTLAVALEVSKTVRSVEFASMLLATSYYYPVLIGMFLAVSLSARMVQIGDISAASFRWHAAWLGLATAILVMSNPLFAGWAVAPVSLALIILARWRNLHFKLVVAAIAAMGIGVVAALILRELLGDMVGRNASRYVGETGSALHYYYSETLLGSASSWRGVVELGLIAILLGLSVYVAIRVFRQPQPMELLLAAIAPPLIVVVVVVGSIATGAGAARYLQPVLFAPLISLLVLGELWRGATAERRGGEVGGEGPARWPQRTAALFAILLVVGGSASAVKLVNYNSTARYAAADCLVEWLDGRDLAGAGGFWLARPMAAFGPKELQLVQMHDNGKPLAWMTNRHDFEQDREITYAVVEENSWFPTATGEPSGQDRAYFDALGEPREIIACDSDNYWIFDYAGTAGAEIMTRQLSKALD